MTAVLAPDPSLPPSASQATGQATSQATSQANSQAVGQSTILAATAPDEPISLSALCRRDGIEFIMATFTTMTGRPCSKLVPVRAAEDLAAGRMGFAGFAAGGMGQEPDDGDLVVVPDLSSYTPLHFIKRGLAMVHCDPYLDGRPHPFSPRQILRAQTARAAALGLSLKVGAEIEYFLVEKGADWHIQVADQTDTALQPCYDARGLIRQFDHLTDVSRAMESLGWQPYASDHEDANGQFEQNFAYDDAMVTADRVITARYIIRMLAEKRAMTATFMPKPFIDRTGNGLHMHMSLWDPTGQPVFPGELSGDSPFGLSAVALSFIAGLLDHAPGLMAVLNPTVNSYKRTAALSTASGATWTPRYASYGGDDRSVMVRVPDNRRIEIRVGDGSACSYLAMAACLGAGLDGVERSARPGPAGAGHHEGRPALARTLMDAVTAFESDAAVRAVFDSVDPAAGVAGYYGALKRSEFYTWHDAISVWEIERYLTA
ncbi:MAG: type III glutamate--ammonia ligase [Bifidobacteriaceae bacterium]|nr:type III glutamate--ammonia ligase [Bifidobacteriaceae bacterium]